MPALAGKKLSVKSVLYFQPLYAILYYTFCEEITNVIIILDFIFLCYLYSFLWSHFFINVT